MTDESRKVPKQHYQYPPFVYADASMRLLSLTSVPLVTVAQVVEGYEVVKAMEACGSQSGATAHEVTVADCGVLWKIPLAEFWKLKAPHSIGAPWACMTMNLLGTSNFIYIYIRCCWPRFFPKVALRLRPDGGFFELHGEWKDNAWWLHELLLVPILNHGTCIWINLRDFPSVHKWFKGRCTWLCISTALVQVTCRACQVF